MYVCILLIIVPPHIFVEPLPFVYIIPQHSTLFAHSNLNGPLLLPSLAQSRSLITALVFIRFGVYRMVRGRLVQEELLPRGGTDRMHPGTDDYGQYL